MSQQTPTGTSSRERRVAVVLLLVMSLSFASAGAFTDGSLADVETLGANIGAGLFGGQAPAGDDAQAALAGTSDCRTTVDGGVDRSPAAAESGEAGVPTTAGEPSAPTTAGESPTDDGCSTTTPAVPQGDGSET